MALRRELLQVAVLAATLLALLPAVAMADPTWLGAETRDASGGRPDVTTDAGGNSAAVWIGSGGEVNAAVRPAGGPWGAPENLEPDGGVQTEDAPHVIAEPDGEMVAVWVGDFSGQLGNYIRWAHKPVGGDWSAAANIAQAVGNAGLLGLEVGASGDVTVLWTQGTVTATPRTTTKPAGSDSWESSDSVPNAPGANLALAVAPGGSAVIAFADQCDTFYLSCVLAEYRPRGGDWSSDPELAAAALGEVTGVAVAARADSSYTVAWGEGAAPVGRVRSQNPPGAVRSADRASGPIGSWADPQAVAVLPGAAAGCRSSRLGCIDLASRGNTLAAVWQQGDGGTGEIAANLRTGTGPWNDTPETVGDPGSGDAVPQAALTADGVAIAAWQAGSGSTGAVVRGAHRNGDGSWDQQDLGTPSQGEGSLTLGDVVADDEGDAVAAWRDPDGARAAGFDGTGPRFTAFALPSGRQGDALPFSAAAKDNWSGVAGISWMFGDGGAADEASPSHAYGSGGNFTAAATATDAVGNETQNSGIVNVAATPILTPIATPPVVTEDPCGLSDRDRDGIKDACDTNDGSEPPVAFKTVNATVVSGEVFIKLPAGAASAAATKPPKGFVRLQGAETIPVGSTLDTAKGRVRLRSASDTRKHTQRGEFFRGRFVIRQVRKPRGKAKRRSTKLITVLTLTGSSFAKTCRVKPKASASARRRSKKRVRRLFGDGKGRFRTSGRNAAATVRGTRWSVQDRCDGTLVTVQRGRVSVRDLVRRRTVIVRTGHKYLARRR